LLIALSRIGRLDLLTLLPTPIRVTEHVWREVAANPGWPGAQALDRARDEGTLVVVEEGDPAAYPQLDAGESTVQTAAATARAIVLVDERKARATIASDPALASAIPLAIGILRLIVLAKRRGVTAAAKPLLASLVEARFWMSPDLIREVLSLADER
jgi:predicted nucleic acid-binding protein